MRSIVPNPLLLAILLIFPIFNSKAHGQLTLDPDKYYHWLLSDQPDFLDLVSTGDSESFTYSFFIDGISYTLEGIVTTSPGTRAWTRPNSFSNPDFPLLNASNAYFMAQLFSGFQPSVTYTLQFDKPLPEGTLLAVMDVDAVNEQEYVDIYSDEIDLYQRFLATVSASTNTINPPLVSSISSNGLSGVRLLSNQASNSPSDVSFFDVSGLTTMTYIGAEFLSASGAGQGNGFAFIVPLTPVPEPSSALLIGLAGLFALRRRRSPSKS